MYRLYRSLGCWPKGGDNKRKTRKRPERQAVKKKTQKIEGVSFLHPCVAVRSRGQAVEEEERKKMEKKGKPGKKERREQRKTRKERQEEMRERQGRESHKNDTVESKENTEARATTPPAQHAFIAIIFIISRESISISRRRKWIETKTGVAIAFVVPRSSNHWLSAEASAPIVFIRISASFQEKESKT